MNGQMIRKVRLNCGYGNYLRSVPRLNVIIIRFESDDSRNKKNEEGKILRKKLLTSVKDKPKISKSEFKVPTYNKTKFRELLSHNIFVSMKTGMKRTPETETENENENVKLKGDYKMKLKHLTESVKDPIKISSFVKEVKVPKLIRKEKTATGATESEKQKFFSLAKQVAQELKIDVSSTQDDLYSYYTETEGITTYIEPSHKISESYVGKKSTKHQKIFNKISSIKEAGYLDIFQKLPEKEAEGRVKPTTAPEESKEQIGESTEEVQEKAGEEVEEVKLEVWEALKKIDLQELCYSPPENYFDELILWTNFGKLHRFPIDNEQDWHEEHGTDFTEHVFLEKYLEPWCPKTGPLRHFMELITTGLSKNPYISVKKKAEHLAWYRDYFFEKSSLLKEVGINLNVEEQKTG